MSIYTLFRNYFTGNDNLPDPKVDLSGCTVIVTGANNGLGKSMTEKLALMNPSRIIMAVRTPSKGEAAKADFLYYHPELNAAMFEIWPLDLASFDSAKSFARRANNDLERLDVLALNAGMIAMTFRKTGDGWEEAVHVNALSTHYLALSLLPLLHRTSAAHYAQSSPTPGPPTPSPPKLSKPYLSIVSSGQHTIATLPKRITPTMNIHEYLNTPEGWTGPGQRYHDTKLLEVLFLPALVELSEKKQGGEGRVICNVSSPGFCLSDLNTPATKVSWSMWWTIQKMRFWSARPTEIGARALTWAAVCGQETGAYSSDCKDGLSSEWSRSDEGRQAAGRVWNETIEILSGIDPSIRKIAAGNF